MRISDWSSDVCSSDLDGELRELAEQVVATGGTLEHAGTTQCQFMIGGRCVIDKTPVARRNHLQALRVAGADEDALQFALCARSEKRRVGKECVSSCRFRWYPSTEKQKSRYK